jgi:hypothetical protein
MNKDTKDFLGRLVIYTFLVIIAVVIMLRVWCPNGC